VEIDGQSFSMLCNDKNMSEDTRTLNLQTGSHNYKISGDVDFQQTYHQQTNVTIAGQGVIDANDGNTFQVVTKEDSSVSLVRLKERK
jgi:hypothetical protein